MGAGEVTGFGAARPELPAGGGVRGPRASVYPGEAGRGLVGSEGGSGRSVLARPRAPGLRLRGKRGPGACGEPRGPGPRGVQ